MTTIKDILKINSLMPDKYQSPRKQKLSLDITDEVMAQRVVGQIRLHMEKQMDTMNKSILYEDFDFGSIYLNKVWIASADWQVSHLGASDVQIELEFFCQPTTLATGPDPDLLSLMKDTH